MASLRNLLFIFSLFAEVFFRLSLAQHRSRFLKPCFEEDKERELEFCSEPNADCYLTEPMKKSPSDFLLVRIDGHKKGHVQEVDLDEERNYTLITKAMKPLMFEIPNFLSHKECDHIVELAKKNGLHTSIAGFNHTVYEGNLDEELATVTTEIPPEKFEYAMDFFLWDRNGDGVIDTEEIKYFIGRNKLLFLDEEELNKMFEKLDFDGYKDDLELILFYYRVIKLTKLPRKLIQGGEALQVVRYGPSGHYHVHYDSMPVHDGKKAELPCCHQRTKEQRNAECRLCRFITILYYLNDVEEGGETAFIVADNATFTRDVLTTPSSTRPRDDFNLSLNCHKANLVVAPKKGHAIMWYNHFIDEDTGLLGEVDEYSLHGGCDVIKGEKWIANNWLTAPPSGRDHIPSVYDIGFD
ncbi:transmembrane prolyl 4-hydroxylase-like [Actinia tenebrosa]|uniref:Transmembrane prolyl 4-hydroxylase-like n=1 Tax=Actinia tenebrosa TaxID=6105 RepID=A0A6P8HTL0_ACTTE|nr:transmembrane prolyl 4-hydroxylase-like [Actinia tenebrosa]